MFNILLIFAIVLSALALIAAGVFVGYHLTELNSNYRAIRSRVANLEEGGGIPDIAIVEAKSPKQIVQEKFDEPDEDSAIIVAKKPKELARDRDRRLNEDLDRLGR